MHATTATIVEMFKARGDSQYGREAVSQLEHALQTAAQAEHDGADADLIAASLLHDIGHLVHDLPDDAPNHGIDDRHEVLGHDWLSRNFGPSVVEPVRLHVDAKRYLCSTDPEYLGQLSEPSVISLRLQGGPMSPEEVAAFRLNPFHDRAVRLRRWDDAAKIPSLPTPSVEHFAQYLDSARTSAPADSGGQTQTR